MVDRQQHRPAPLAGVRVVDFTHVISGPFAAQILGDLGAEVIKIEGVERGDIGREMTPMIADQSSYFVAFNRNKRSIALDLKSAAGKEVAMKLLRTADVVLENFAPGVMGRLGFGYEAVRAINPAVVYCSISGFGQTGPLAQKRSLDLVAQAYSGMMSTNGVAGGPPLKVGVPIGDAAGSLFASIGVLAALHRRRETGEGEYIDIGMYDCLMSLLVNHGSYYLATGEQPARAGSDHYVTVPYGTVEAADGEIAIAVMTDSNWAGFCRTLGLDGLISDPRFNTISGRSEHRQELYSMLRPALKRHTVADLIERFGAADVPCAPVNDIGAAYGHPHTAARKMILDVTHPVYGTLRTTSLPLGSLMRAEHQAPPLHGEQTVAILGELGYEAAAIEELLRAGSARQCETKSGGGFPQTGESKCAVST